ncbi:MAG TPA: putative hydro-lyase [Thiolinea sp.]|nr:putative hydro-lyase [Thiolinea sp.]
MNTTTTPAALRQRIRSGEFTANTSGYCPGFVQCNMAILPRDWADEFLQFCQFNPKPCPVLGMAEAGSVEIPSLAAGLDVRTDLPRYRVFENGRFSAEVTDIRELWQDDFVTFMLGCSFSFEEALQADGLEIRNVTEKRNVPMYRTDIDCTPAGRFRGQMVVSMRPFRAADAIRAIQICTRFPAVHGAPVHLGDPAQIGIADLSQPDYGESVTVRDGEIPLFWACGVTPQVAIEQARPPICITHSPGCMLVTDIPNSRLAIM